MDMVISSLVGAVSAIIVAFIHLKNAKKQKDKTCEKIINSLNVDRGNIIIIDSDSRKGFDFKGFERKLSLKEGYCGRGIPLLLGMCRRFEYFGSGNIVEAEFEWQI